MEIVCFGLSHHTAPIELREKFAISDSELPKVATEMAQLDGVGEAVVVSTCNRVEFYVAVEELGEGVGALQRYVAARTGAAADDAFFRHGSSRGIAHLFRVVSGLDSMVLGETEILGQ